MSDLICRKTMRVCQQQSMCAPFQGCGDFGPSKYYVHLPPVLTIEDHAGDANNMIAVPAPPVAEMPVSGWISVDTRLPEAEVDVLCGRFDGLKPPFVAGLFHGIWKMWSDTEMDEPTHWMPLPPSPDEAKT